jgi:hypothetical protein
MNENERNRRAWYGDRDPRFTRYPYGQPRRGGEERPQESDFFSGSNEPQYFGTGRYGDTPEYGAESRDRIDAYRHFPRAGGYGEAALYGTPGPPAGYRGGRYGYQDGPGPRRGPKGYVRSDERLKEDISERLLHAHELDASDVTVDVKDGKVTLTGTVPHRYMKHRIEDIADACAGVRDLENRIRVENRT